MNDHSPLPWRLDGAEVVDRDGYGVSAIFHGLLAKPVQCNGDFIVRACNSHADLLNALKATISLVLDPSIYDVNTTLAAARAAIAKAEGPGC